MWEHVSDSVLFSLKRHVHDTSLSAALVRPHAEHIPSADNHWADSADVVEWDQYVNYLSKKVLANGASVKHADELSTKIKDIPRKEQVVDVSWHSDNGNSKSFTVMKIITKPRRMARVQVAVFSYTRVWTISDYTGLADMCAKPASGWVRGIFSSTKFWWQSVDSHVEEYVANAATKTLLDKLGLDSGGVPDTSLSVQQRFYKWQFICSALHFLIMRLKTGAHLHTRTGSVFTRPWWLPARILLRLHRLQSVIFQGFIGVLAIAAVRGDSLLVRTMTAVVVSLYHLLETSVTNRHGEYPLLHNVWAMLLPSAYAEAASLGIAINFVFSTGIAKLQVGGLKWMYPATMRTYLNIYRNSNSVPPLSKTFNQFLATRSWATGAIGVGTVLLECIMIPATLLLPARFRLSSTVLMVGMHFGISAAMSGMVGYLFMTALPSYVIGFSCKAAPKTTPWILAALISFLPSVFSGLLGSPLSESWPLSPTALFMWPGDCADLLCRSLMNQDTRVVLSTTEVAADIVGLPIVPNGFSAAKYGGRAVHDALTRVIGFTLAQGPLARTVFTIKEIQDRAKGNWEMQHFLLSLQDWLIASGRLIEMDTARVLTRAFLVRIKNGRVLEILGAVPQ